MPDLWRRIGGSVTRAESATLGLKQGIRTGGSEGKGLTGAGPNCDLVTAGLGVRQD